MEIDFNRPYWSTTNGQRLQGFATFINNPAFDHKFPLSIYKTADLLNATSRHGGREIIRKWHTSGLIASSDIRQLSREAIVLLLQTKVHALNNLTYGDIHKRLSEDLAQTGLESHIGNLNKACSNTRSNRGFMSPDDPWYTERFVLSGERSFGIDFGNKVILPGYSRRITAH